MPVVKKSKNHFYDSTVNGKEMLVHFAFPKSYFTKNLKDKNDRVFYKVGVMTDIRWSQIASSAVETSMTSRKALDIYSGSTYGQGQMLFRSFYQDSLELVKENVFKGITENGKNYVPEIAQTEDNPYITFEDLDIIEANSGITTDPGEIDWIQMPFFDIYFTSMATGADGARKPSQYVVRSVKITSEGFGITTESLEINNVVTFISIKDISGWKEVEGINVI